MSILQLSPPTSQFSSHPNPPTTSDRGIVFHEKVRYLKALKVNPKKAFHLNPTLRSSPLAALESVTRCLYSLGVPRAALGRILDMHPVLLTCDPYSQLYPLLDFLLHEVPIPFPDIHLCILRCPRLLVSSIDNQLRPTLFFLRELGFCGPHSLTCQTTLLLVSSLEDTLLPKIEFLKSLGFTHVEVSNMVVRSPGLLTLSVKKNLVPKVEFFLKEMNGDVAELKRFPQYFSFSLERRIRPRFRMLRQLGVPMPLEDMLKLPKLLCSEFQGSAICSEFQSYLPISLDFFFRIFIVGELQLRIGLVVRVASRLLHVLAVASQYADPLHMSSGALMEDEKDYAMESDETRTHLMIASLVGSLPHVSCKEALRASISGQLRTSLQNLNIVEDFTSDSI